jgi:hypothetical protein
VKGQHISESGVTEFEIHPGMTPEGRVVYTNLTEIRVKAGDILAVGPFQWIVPEPPVVAQ